jgi:tripartite-type tricarboxylate transporter receptor subunit TctC
VASPEVASRIQSLGSAAIVNTPEEYTQQIVKETDQWAMVIQKANIKPD